MTDVAPHPTAVAAVGFGPSAGLWTPAPAAVAPPQKGAAAQCPPESLPLSAMVTVLVVTSPVRSDPSLGLLAATLGSFRHAPGLVDCRLLVVCSAGPDPMTVDQARAIPATSRARPRPAPLSVLGALPKSDGQRRTAVAPRCDGWEAPRPAGERATVAAGRRCPSSRTVERERARCYVARVRARGAGDMGRHLLSLVLLPLCS